MRHQNVKVLTEELARSCPPCVRLGSSLFEGLGLTGSGGGFAVAEGEVLEEESSDG